MCWAEFVEVRLVTWINNIQSIRDVMLTNHGLQPGCVAGGISGRVL